MKKAITVTVWSLALGLISMWSCSELKSPVEPSMDNADQSATIQRNVKTSIASFSSLYGEMTYDLNSSREKRLKIKNVLVFKTSGKDIIPPEGITDKITISVSVRKVNSSHDFPNGSLLFDFNPSGTSFDPPAKLELSYRLLGCSPSESISLYLWNGHEWEKISTLLENSRDYKWNKKNQRVMFNIPHFSLWAIAKD